LQGAWPDLSICTDRPRGDFELDSQAIDSYRFSQLARKLD